MGEFRVCSTAKVPYWSEADAKAAAQRMNDKRSEQNFVGTPWGPYFCDKCRQWHIGRRWQ